VKPQAAEDDASATRIAVSMVTRSGVRGKQLKTDQPRYCLHQNVIALLQETPTGL